MSIGFHKLVPSAYKLPCSLPINSYFTITIRSLQGSSLFSQNHLVM